MDEKDIQSPDSTTSPTTDVRPGLSALAITLLKGVIYRDADERLWGSLLDLRAPVRDYVAVLGLDLILDEAEGYAFLKSRPDSDGAQDDQPVRRLMARRSLSFPVSLLIALLRRKLAEFDAGVQDGGGGRLVLTRDDIVELLRVFLPETSNEAKLIDQIDAHINKVIDLGFLRRLKSTAGQTTGPGSYEVRRILKAFVDAQWLADFDARLATYQALASGEDAAKDDADG